MASEKQRFSNRLNKALDEIDYPPLGQGRQSDLSKAINQNSALVGKWLKGEEFPPTSALVKISKIAQVGSNWLLSGQGEKAQTQKIRRKIGTSELYNISDEAIELAVSWSKLPKRQRDVLTKLIKEMGR